MIYGCMEIGGAWNNSAPSKEEITRGFQALDAAFEVGFDTFDHADIYTLGKAEQVFGLYLKDRRVKRESLFIQSKAGIRLGQSHNGSSYYDFRKDYLIGQVEKSLQYLQIDYLDALLLHRPDVLWDPSALAETFDLLKDKGMVRSFGVSNMNLHQINLLQHYWKEPLFANQIQLSLGHRALIDEAVMGNNGAATVHSGMDGMLEYGVKKNFTLQAWGCLDRGRYLNTEAALDEKDKQVAIFLNQLAKKYGVSAGAVQLAWLQTPAAPIVPVIGTTNPDRIRALAQAKNLKLDHKDWYDLWVCARGVALP